MAFRTLGTRLVVDGEKAFKESMSSANRELRGLREELKLSEAQFKGQANSVNALTEKQKLLQRQVEQQQEKVRALEGALEDASAAYGETDRRTDDFRQSLTRAQRELIEMNRDLQDTEKYLEEAGKSADGTADSIDEFGRAVKDTGDNSGGLELNLENLIGSVGNLKGLLAGGAAGLGIGAIKEIAGAVMDIEESTREWRSIMGGLEVSSEAAGYSAEQTADAYDYLYGVLGDNQTTATTVANLQAIGLSQEDLMAVIDMTTGAWSKYGDSIPIDGLAESINETVRAGEITGTFSDVINWGSDELNTFGVALKEDTEANKEWNEAVEAAKTSEDFFNLALQECSTNAERADLVMKAMSEQGLADAGKAWRDINKDIEDANNTQNRMEKAMGELGTTLAPVADFFRNTLAGAIEGVTKTLQDLFDWLGDVGKKVDEWSDNWNRRAFEKRGMEYPGEGTTGAQSHAMGLDRVPYDGYLAELHWNEAVLTAQEAELWRSLRRAGTAHKTGVTVEDIQTVAAAAVNGVSAVSSGSGIPEEITLVLRSEDGQNMGRWLVPFVRSENKSNPEVVSDPL